MNIKNDVAVAKNFPQLSQKQLIADVKINGPFPYTIRGRQYETKKGPIK